jgi:hypothetical protein
MTPEEQYYYNKASQDVHYSDRQHEAAMTALIEKQEYNLFSMLTPKVSRDGNKWCVLYGENLQEGIAGFGDTLYLAILDFNKSFHKPPQP